MAENRKLGTNRLDTTNKGRAYFNEPFGINKEKLSVVDQGWEGYVLTIGSNNLLSLTTGGGGSIALGNKISTGSITASVNVGANTFRVQSGSSTFLYISSSGNVGIGTTTPSSTLHVSGTFRTQLSTTTQTKVLGVDSNGNVTIFDTSSIVAAGGGGNVIGTGTSNYVPLWTGASIIATSSLFRYGDGHYQLIGPSSPGYGIHLIAAGSGPIIGFSNDTGESNSGSLSIIGAFSNNFNIQHRLANGNIVFWTSGSTGVTEKMRITATGNVGIGTTSPTNTLQVVGDITATSFTGSLLGTASVAVNAQTASFLPVGTYSITSSQAINAQTASNITPSITNNTDNRVLTATGGGTINGETNLTFDGSILNITSADVYLSNNRVLRWYDNQSNTLIPILKGNYTYNVGPFNDFVSGTSSLLTNGTTKIELRSSVENILGGFDSGSIFFKTPSGSEMTYTNEGRLGIGTTTPSARLTVAGSGTGRALIGDLYGSQNYTGISLNSTSSGTTYNLLSSPTDQHLYINRPSGRNIRFKEGDGEPDQMTISSSGNVGIGTQTPSAKLDVSGSTIIRGALTASIISASSWISGSDLRISNTSTIGGTLGVTGATTLVGALTASIISASSWISGSDLRISNTSTIGGTLGVTGISTFADVLSSPTFFSGFAGSGWKLDKTNKYSLEVDDLTVRGTMKVYELLISQIRATNGSIFVSNTGKVETVTDLGNNTYYLTFDTGSQYGHSFKVGDIIRAQRFNITASTIYQCNLIVAGVPNTQALTASFDGTYGTSSYGIGIYGAGITAITAPTGGMEFVRLGSTVDTNRQGTVYLTADDNNAPFVDVKDGVTSHDGFNSYNTTKVRMGKLDGIISPLFGQLSGYGLWASGSAYLEGTVNATAGKVGGFTITNDAISGTGFFLSGSATGNGFFISASNFNVKADGTITASNAILSGTITANAGRIGGFAITQDAITGSGFFLSGSATGNGFFISASNFNVKADGTITASAGLIGGFNTTTTEIQTTGSVTAVDNDTRTSITYPQLSLNNQGKITGSNLVVRTLIPSASTHVSYKLIDTEAGVADFKNIGRPVLNVPNPAFISTGPTTIQGATTYQGEIWKTFYDSAPIYLLPGENLLLISMQVLGSAGIEGSSDQAGLESNRKARHNVRLLMAVASGSNNIAQVGVPQPSSALISVDTKNGQRGIDGSNNAAGYNAIIGLYNNWSVTPPTYITNSFANNLTFEIWRLFGTAGNSNNNSYQTAPVAGLSSGTGSFSMLVTPSSSLGVVIIPTASRGQFVKIFAQIYISQSQNNATVTVGGTPRAANAFTAVSNLQVTTARGYTAASVGGGTNTFDPNADYGLSLP